MESNQLSTLSVARKAPRCASHWYAKVLSFRGGGGEKTTQANKQTTANTGLITIAKKPTRASRVPTSKFWGMPNTVLLNPAHPSHALATHALPGSGFSFSFSLIRICDRYHLLSSAGIRQYPDVAETYNFGLGVEYLPANPALGPDVSWRDSFPASEGSRVLYIRPERVSRRLRITSPWPNDEGKFQRSGGRPIARWFEDSHCMSATIKERRLERKLVVQGIRISRYILRIADISARWTQHST
ncbi:hypothetical protein QBC33DRAFT_354666 [Phialemonium atrogriseum]|uniref:Uncharacterized protein n=1 Tax=Phialemonium atrogriseum TaxID=1093897 RepID=A0AAJ0C367_9PEZI|nr:uncharacterized protein QBC33DRAFT_354666 [Phialemonium atrogriseum]KAK1768662.1 hypothetical protein QBC33DRAFT_354666 [Phialemonium atrogriseum]